MADYQLLSGTTAVLRRADGASIPDDPKNSDHQQYQVWLDAGNTPDPADPLPLVYSLSTHVEARLRTTDATAHEIFRFPCVTKHLYQASLAISGVDAGNFTSKIMEGRFTWKMPSGVAAMVGIVVVSDIHDAAAAAWAPNAVPTGSDVVFTVQGVAGRNIDWLLTGNVGSFAPEGT